MIFEKKKNYIKINNIYINLNNIFQIEIDSEENQIILIFNKQEDFKTICVDYNKEQYYFIIKTLNNWFLNNKSIVEKIKDFIKEKIKKGENKKWK